MNVVVVAEAESEDELVVAVECEFFVEVDGISGDALTNVLCSESEDERGLADDEAEVDEPSLVDDAVGMVDSEVGVELADDDGVDDEDVVSDVVEVDESFSVDGVADAVAAGVEVGLADDDGVDTTDVDVVEVDESLLIADEADAVDSEVDIELAEDGGVDDEDVAADVADAVNAEVDVELADDEGDGVDLLDDEDVDDAVDEPGGGDDGKLQSVRMSSGELLDHILVLLLRLRTCQNPEVVDSLQNRYLQMASE